MSEEVMKVIAEQEIFGKTFHVYGDWLEPMFLAKEVAELIDYAKRSNGTYQTGQMLKSVDDDEKIIRPTYTSGGVQKLWFLTPYGLRTVLKRSRKPIAKEISKQIASIFADIQDPDTLIKSKKYIEICSI